MCYGEKKADLVITGLEKPINDHLLKLVAVAARGAMTDLEIEALVDRFARGEPVDAA